MKRKTKGKLRALFSDRMIKKVQSLHYDHGYECYYCGNKVTTFAARPEHKATIEHVVPASSGRVGCRDKANLALSCWRCNNAKGDMHIKEFVKALHQFQAKG